jgi:hypothetical protein
MTLPAATSGGRMSWVRTWLPITIIGAGLVLGLATRFSEIGLEGGALLVSAGLSVWLLNALYRIGVRGDRERDDEAHARTFFDEHGYWPDQAPRPRDETRGSGTASP